MDNRGINIDYEKMIEILESLKEPVVMTLGYDGMMKARENTPLPASGSQTFVLDHDGQEEYKIPYYEYDVDNHPGMTRTDQDGMEQVDILTVELPPGLKKKDTEIEVSFDIQVDGSIEIKAVTKDKSGNIIVDRHLKIKHEHDWE